MVSRTLNSQAITNCIIQGDTIVALARPRNPQSPGYSLLLEGTSAEELSSAEGAVREVIQSASIEFLTEPKRLLARVISVLEPEKGIDGAGIVVHYNQRAWLGTVGGVQAYKWTATDSLAPLSPWRIPSKGMRWFRSKKSVPLAETDRLLLTSKACSTLFQEEKLLYLHSNEIDSWLRSRVQGPYGVAWSGGARTASNQSFRNVKDAPHATRESGRSNVGPVIRVALFVALMMAVGGTIGTFLVHSTESDNPREDLAIGPEPIKQDSTSRSELSSVLPVDNKKADFLDVDGPQNSEEGEASIEPESSPEDWLSDFVSESTEIGRQASYLLRGEHGKALRALPTVPPLPDPSQLPVSLRSFFVPEPRENPKMFAKQLEAQLKTTLALGDLEFLEELETQVTFRATSPHVRAWLQVIRSFSESAILREWAEQHLKRERPIPSPKRRQSGGGQ